MRAARLSMQVMSDHDRPEPIDDVADDGHPRVSHLRHTLARRLRLSDEQFGAARQQLIDLDLIAYSSPLYQVLALPGTVAAQRPAPRAPGATRDVTGANSTTTGGQPVSLATLLQQAQARRG